ncbi:MAG TPA: hypothetical protein VFI91_13225 [Longimicrobiaceae bacterium]|nr:hypothetical protein [Longimicrobiaceae bacterium]
MERQDSFDFLSAFAVGTVLGIGATLLLKPERTRKERIMRQLKPYRKQMRRNYSQARNAVRGGSDATAEMSSEFISAGREILSEFRSEITDILADARKDLQEMVEDRTRGAEKGLRKTRRKMGL